MRLRNQLVRAAENCNSEVNLSPVLRPKMSRNTNEQFKFAQKVVDVVDPVNRNVCMTLLQYNTDEPGSFFAAHVRFFARSEEEEKFQQNVIMKFNQAEFIYFSDVMNSVYDKNFSKKPICNVL